MKKHPSLNSNSEGMHNYGMLAHRVTSPLNNRKRNARGLPLNKSARKYLLMIFYLHHSHYSKSPFWLKKEMALDCAVPIHALFPLHDSLFVRLVEQTGESAFDEPTVSSPHRSLGGKR